MVPDSGLPEMLFGQIDQREGVCIFLAEKWGVWKFVLAPQTQTMGDRPLSRKGIQQARSAASRLSLNKYSTINTNCLSCTIDLLKI
jgi:hypothetical protein